MTQLTINKIRVYVSSGKVIRCDGDYSRKATDLRYVIVPVAEYDIKAVGRTRAKPSVLAKEAGAELAINFPYFNEADGALLGQAIVSGAPLSYETAKTKDRAEFYSVGGKYGISVKPPAIVDFAIQGSPELLRNGSVVVAESIKRDQLSISASDRSQRTAVGVRANGDVVLVVSDGRTSDDLGLTFEELALVFRDQLGCTSAHNGDGGGSSIMYVNGAIVNQALNRNNERGTGCALIVKRKIVTPIPKPDAELKFVIDGGHGPQTAGKRCPDDSMREFSFNSVVARYVRDGLAAYENVVTKFTHADNGSRDVPLTERVKVANDWGADAFVSIHANAFGEAWNDANGIETFTSTGPSATSVKLAAAVQKALIGVTGRKDRGVKQADFTVIYKTKMPAILTECGGFMTNAEEAALMKTDAYRKKCAAAIVAGIAEVFALKKKAEAKPVSKDVVTVIVNGKKIADGKIEDGVTYVPARAVAESLGANVAWDGVSQTVSITK